MDEATRTVIGYFEAINRIPRCSKNEQAVSRWLQGWAAERRLPAASDAAGNLLIRVPATDGLENAPTVILQGHMDMVCEKRDGSGHDFSKDPIRLIQDGPWLRAQETTLGADNGIALALSLALVDDPAVMHPPLELYFTVDEETGLTGVRQMDPEMLTGRLLINLDSEDEGVFVVGCAGGRNTTITRSLARVPMDTGHDRLTVSALGMQGGHSGVDIAKHRANANKVMARLLRAALSVSSVKLLTVDGGTGRNVIPRTCTAVLAIPHVDLAAVIDAMEAMAAVIQREYRTTDPGLVVHMETQGPVGAAEHGVPPGDTARVVDLLTALPSGPVAMMAEDPLLVETSVNLSLVTVDDVGLSITSNQRSSVPTCLDAVCRTVEAVGRLAQGTVATSDGYPSWPVNRASPLLARCTSIYRDLFATDPVVQVMHAGLECGVIGDRCPGMDMLSLGPTMENPHSPSERLFLPSVEKVWRLMVALLASFAPQADETRPAG